MNNMKNMEVGSRAFKSVKAKNVCTLQVEKTIKHLIRFLYYCHIHWNYRDEQITDKGESPFPYDMNGFNCQVFNINMMNMELKMHKTVPWSPLYGTQISASLMSLLYIYLHKKQHLSRIPCAKYYGYINKAELQLAVTRPCSQNLAHKVICMNKESIKFGLNQGKHFSKFHVLLQCCKLLNVSSYTTLYWMFLRLACYYSNATMSMKLSLEGWSLSHKTLCSQICVYAFQAFLQYSLVKIRNIKLLPQVKKARLQEAKRFLQGYKIAYIYSLPLAFPKIFRSR